MPLCCRPFPGTQKQHDATVQDEREACNHHGETVAQTVSLNNRLLSRERWAKKTFTMVAVRTTHTPVRWTVEGPGQLEGRGSRDMG